MHDLWQTIECQNRHALAGETSAGRGAVLISTRSEPGATRNAAPHAEQLSADSQALLREAVRVLRFGALLFIYGAPRELALWGRSAERLAGGARLLFKYWIALDLDPACRDGLLQPAHRGLLLFQKVSAHRKTRPPFPLQAAAARVPHQSCAACGRTLKDWGGKRHLMHPQGAALSDVWRDLSPQHLADSVARAAVLQRLAALTPDAAGQRLHLFQTAATYPPGVPEPPDLVLTADTADSRAAVAVAQTERAGFISRLCMFLERVARLYPEGIFDMVFADPPYNLEKNYAAYADDLAERHYLAWCEHWLAGMARTLKPGGSLFVLNLPRWAMYHAAFLHAHLTFRHWIACDALSEPLGRHMPAHYALFDYTKPGGNRSSTIVAWGADQEGDAGMQ